MYAFESSNPQGLEITTLHYTDRHVVELLCGVQGGQPSLIALYVSIHLHANRITCIYLCAMVQCCLLVHCCIV